jgi:RsiW-degrading membrane proteinase PrsW (M82 family)
MNIVLGFVIALIVPLLFLGFIYTFDVYQTGQFHIILKCLFCGGVTFAPATFTNWALTRFGLTNQDAITHFAAPIYEEIFKGLILLYLVRRAKFTYSVDGAIYGFAVGTGFAVVENCFYIYTNFPAASQIAFQRVFLANLVHAFSSAAIGITLGIFRLETSKLRWGIPTFGLLLAIGQHMLFNNLIGREEIHPVVFFLPVLPGILFILFVMQHGKKQAQGWIKEKLGMDNRVTRGEVALVDHLAAPDDSLYPVVERFGAETASQVEKLLYLQAYIGIKTKALDGLRCNDTIYKAVEAEINEMRIKMKKIQSEIGAYPMLFVRGLFTDEMASVWEQMQSKIKERSAATGGQKGGGLWSSLEERLKSSTAEGRFE